jgi:uncharacterized protein (TIGR03000 family)
VPGLEYYFPAEPPAPRGLDYYYPEFARRTPPPNDPPRPGTPSPDRNISPANRDVTEPIDDNVVQVTVKLPAGAELFVNGERMALRGTNRRFISPPLDPNRKYSYTVQARWTEKGRPVQRSTKIPVHAGERLTVDFTLPEAE